MQGLVEDLLLLARLDAGRPLDREPVDLSLLAMDAVSDAHAAAPDHRWELDLPDEPVEVTGDHARLHQVVANLLANARTHTPAGTRVVMSVKPDGQWVRVSVSDDGPGVPESLQGNVFNRFTRGDDSRNRAAGSTGPGPVDRRRGGQVARRQRRARPPPPVTRSSPSPSPAGDRSGSQPRRQRCGHGPARSLRAFPPS